MYKIRKITYHNHPVLKNLSLDFCDHEGKAVNTVIIAGENGTGKSTVLESIYKIASRTIDFEVDVELEKENETVFLEYRKDKNFKDITLVSDDRELKDINHRLNRYVKKYPMAAIYSDIDIHFRSRQIGSVTSLELDDQNESRRSDNDLSTKINQLIVDIQASDDADVALAVRNNPELLAKDLPVQLRMPRFTNAFSTMFTDLEYSRIENKNGHKNILFSKNGLDIPIENLSSGEKQIVYRGCFLLKDINAMHGAFGLIDEPEISLHPIWQTKILDFYKNIFTDTSGNQTSQIVVVTHSPFIIHNEYRKQDKVIILKRDENGNIVMMDKVEYFKCTSVEVVQDAFSIHNFRSDESFVYLEGRTDEKYFNKAIEVYGLQVPFQFRWVGHMNSSNQEENTGKDSLGKAYSFLVGQSLHYKSVCLFDCDAKRDEKNENNIYIRTMPEYDNKFMKRGIENALILDGMDIRGFYHEKCKITDYGERNTFQSLDKMALCEHICCKLDPEAQQRVLLHLKDEIEQLMKIFRD